MRVLRILLIGNYPPDRQESMLRYTALLETELKARGHMVEVLQPEDVLAKAVGKGGLRKWMAWADKFFVFPPRLKRVLRGFDIVHICDHSNSIYAKHVQAKPNVVTCHDVMAIRSALGELPEWRVSSTGRRLQQLILAGLKRAQYVVCVSAESEKDLLRVTGRPASGSEVIDNAMVYPYTPMPREQALARLAALGFDAHEPFFLHVGADSWYKNRLGLLQIFDGLRERLGAGAPRLLVVGPPLGDELDAYVRDHGLEGRVARLSGLANEDLRAVYSLAEALLFPSFYEGFGWPILEAQACGCPVFTSNRAPMTDLGADAAVYFDPADAAGAAEIVAQNLPRADEMRSAGLANVGRFGLQKMIDRYLVMYDRVISQHAARDVETR